MFTMATPRRWKQSTGVVFSFVVALSLLANAALAGDLSLVWKDGFRVLDKEAGVEIAVGGRIMSDWVFMNEDEDLSVSTQDGTEFRRARIYVGGKLGNGVVFKSQVDFAGGEVEYKDMYMGLGGVPGVDNVRVGQFYEPFGLEEITSSNYITFMERSPSGLFNPSRNSGFMVHRNFGEKRFSGALGVFRDTDEAGDGTGEGRYNVTGRVTAVAWEGEDSDQFVHVGLAGSTRQPNGESVKYSARPSSHLTGELVDTGDIDATTVNLVGAELAVVAGPISVQGEYKMAMVDAKMGDDPSFSSWYVQASWFPTGESRPYSRSGGVFSRVRPVENYGDGSGAWELAARLSHVDLDDGEIEGGELDDITLGVNWYINPNARVMANYVIGDATAPGDFSAFQMRFMVSY